MEMMAMRALTLRKAASTKMKRLRPQIAQIMYRAAAPLVCDIGRIRVERSLAIKMFERPDALHYETRPSSCVIARSESPSDAAISFGSDDDIVCAQRDCFVEDSSQ